MGIVDLHILITITTLHFSKSLIIRSAKQQLKSEKGEGLRKRERNNLPNAGSFPNDHNSQGWARIKASARQTILVCHMGGRGPSTWALLHCLIIRELD